ARALDEAFELAALLRRDLARERLPRGRDRLVEAAGALGLGRVLHVRFDPPPLARARKEAACLVGLAKLERQVDLLLGAGAVALRGQALRGLEGARDRELLLARFEPAVFMEDLVEPLRRLRERLLVFPVERLLRDRFEPHRLGAKPRVERFEPRARAAVG